MRAVVLSAMMLALSGPGLAQDADRGARLYEQSCAVCHGAGLRGSGPMAEVLVVPPPDLTRIAERHGGFPRVGMARVIDGRDPLMSHGGEMPLFGFVFGDMSAVLREGGQTLVTAPEVLDLLAFLEEMQE